ncbi:AAA family ATPase [Jannaschia donghaensis]|uniref:Topology modulation protein n=1 Tax=Jannaschia donghaensis TaxID=420998 RepID=A0A0M6YG64_9RHOB|nr:AAA family ATPase [Jannaschia donghaensis]CTQ48665.1 topology modulation protein [Jannaschia donghaensis]
MRRVMIIGQPGSGKSTLARAVGEIAHLPVVHIDMIHWMPGWVERDRAEKTRMCNAVHRRPAWVFEGGHTATWEDRLARADTLIWLDLPVALRLWRVTRRTAMSWGRVRPDVPEDCPERFSAEFFGFIWRTRATARARCARLFASAGGEKATHHLRRPSDVSSYLAALRRAAQRGNLGISHR